MRADFAYLHSVVGDDVSTAEEDFTYYDAALTAAIECFDAAYAAFNPSTPYEEQRTALGVCHALLPNMSGESIGGVSLSEEATMDRLKQMWTASHAWVMKLWESTKALGVKALSRINQAIDKLKGRDDREQVNTKFDPKKMQSNLKVVPGQIKKLADQVPGALKSEKEFGVWKAAMVVLKALIAAPFMVVGKIWKIYVSELRAVLTYSAAGLSVWMADMDGFKRMFSESLRGEFFGRSALGWQWSAYNFMFKAIFNLEKTFIDECLAMANIA